MKAYKLGKREKAMLILLTILFFSYAGYRLALATHIQNHYKTKAELHEIRNHISQLSAQAGSVEEEKAALEKTKKRIADLSAGLDTEMRDGQFIIQLSRVTEKNQVIVRKFKPLNIIDSKHFIVLPVEIELRGLFPQVSAVINYLENLPNLSELRDVQINRYIPENAAAQSPPGGDGILSYVMPAAPDGTVTVNMTLLIYSRPTPAARLEMEEVIRWSLGRPNPFFSAALPALPEPPARAQVPDNAE